MSDTLTLVNELTGWRIFVRPASYRGVPFWTEVTEGQGGRRKVVHEFPQRDDPYIEDLGRCAKRHKIAAFVLGDGYMLLRDALISACQDYPDAATLVHPYLGELSCHAGALTYRESQQFGGSAIFDIEFIEDGAQPSPISGSDTASALLGGLASLQQVLATAYQSVSLVAVDTAFVLTYATTLLQLASTMFVGLPASTVAPVGTLPAAIAATPSVDADTASAVQAAFSACVDAVVAAETAPIVVTDDPVLPTNPILAPPLDPSGGLAALASWGSTLAAPPGVGAVQGAQAQQQAAIVALVQGNAVAAVLAIYAQIDWPTVNDAEAARGQVVALLGAQADTAAAAGQDDLYRAWLAITGLAVQDLIQRVQGLPTQAPYAAPMVLPALTLAGLLYQDASRADELVAMNDVAHPLFMPIAGLRLSA
jgi:prophage DNA circulation protein